MESKAKNYEERRTKIIMLNWKIMGIVQDNSNTLDTIEYCSTLHC